MLIDAVFSTCIVTEVFFEIFVCCAVITMSFGNQIIFDKKQKFWHSAHLFALLKMLVFSA